MKKINIILLFLYSSVYLAQNWKLELTSNVYLRTWKLNTKAIEEEKEISGATIKLYQNGKEIDQTTSNSEGEFKIMVPPNGEYYLIVSYPGCNAKRMAVNTQNVPEGIFTENVKPSFKITGGFIMVKPYPGINYSELSQDLIRVEYFSNKKAFDDNPKATEKGLSIVSKIYSAEDVLFKEFCSTNKSGDIALEKPDCPLAKQLYQKSMALIPGEQYPIEQLAKVGDCLKEIEERKKKAEEAALAEQAKKEEAAKAKEEAEKLAAQKKVEKQEADKLAAQKKAEQAEADKLAKEKAKAEKQEADKKAAEQKNQEKLAKQKEQSLKSKPPVEKTAEDEKKLAKKKADEEKARKQKEGLAKSKAEDEAAMKADYEKKMAKRKAQEEEDEKRRLAYETEKKEHDAEMDKGNSKYKIPQVLGKDMYKENIQKADTYFKTKRYKEAKQSYEDALNIKPADPYATKRIEECTKLLEPK
ncbi:MAG: hypothetical protein IPM51_00925 [Sphingobacteriaceae bacterium]|nr:hypothetical protein [Sphingobacteriaceae bacterium]